MADRRHFAWLGTGLLAMSLTGCVTVVGADTPITSTSTTPHVDRPRVLDLTHVDPCTLFSAAQQRVFGIDSPARPGESSVFESKSCRFPNDKAFESFYLVPVPHTGADRFAGGKVNADVRETAVSGFPSRDLVVRTRPPGEAPACDVVVDVAPGQVLIVGFSETRGYGPVRDEGFACRRAHEAAEAAISTLMTTT
ncbi:hypothetical protein GCM10022247_15160 [Allokutzneria multivorans]|uniref:DUF3558 domain-containing protein n=1 Tax=Allokutzneria multivorans TaxID=1142134 RepID=A0ABP7RE36_9PSEU